MNNSELRSQVATAIGACEAKKAENIAILQMDKSSSGFTDFFLIGSGANPRQVQAIADEVELQLKRDGVYPNAIEGYQRAEWILIDYVDFVVHVFHEPTRKFYDLERLWKSAKRLTVDELKAVPTRKKASVAPAAAKRSKGARSRATAEIGRAVRSATSRRKPATRKKSVKAVAKSAKPQRKKK